MKKRLLNSLIEGYQILNEAPEGKDDDEKLDAQQLDLSGGNSVKVGSSSSIVDPETYIKMKNKSRLDALNYLAVCLTQVNTINTDYNEVVKVGYAKVHPILNSLYLSLEALGTTYAKNRYSMYCRLLTLALKDLSGLNLANFNGIFSLFLQGSVALVKDNKSLLEGLDRKACYDRSRNDCLYTITVIDNLLYRRKLPFDEDLCKLALARILANGTVLPAGMNSTNPDEECIWNVINEYENYSADPTKSSEAEDNKRATSELTDEQKELTRSEISDAVNKSLLKRGVSERDAERMTKSAINSLGL